MRPALTTEQLSGARRRALEGRAAKFTRAVQVALQELWERAAAVSDADDFPEMRQAAERLRAAHSEAGWTEAESLLEVIAILQSAMDATLGQLDRHALPPTRELAILLELADALGVDLSPGAA